MEIKWALKHTGATVCLRFAPLEISTHALCVAQRDDKLKRGQPERSSAEDKNTDAGGIEGVFLQLSLQDQGPGVFGHGSRRKEKKRKEGRQGLFVVTPVCVNYVE